MTEAPSLHVCSYNARRKEGDRVTLHWFSKFHFEMMYNSTHILLAKTSYVATNNLTRIEKSKILPLSYETWNHCEQFDELFTQQRYAA